MQIESRLENPTKYHMLESQRKQVTLNFYQTQKLEIHLKNLLNHDDTLKTLAQVADFLSEGESSLPQPERTSLAVSPAPGDSVNDKV